MIAFFLKGDRHRLYFIDEGSHDTLGDLPDKLKAKGKIAALFRGKPELAARRDHPEEWKKLMAVIVRALRNGIETMNPTRCKHFTFKDVDVWEFKAQHLRVFFFQEDPDATETCKTLINTHVCVKKQDKTPPGELERFVRLRKAYYDWREEIGVRDAIAAEFYLSQRDNP